MKLKFTITGIEQCNKMIDSLVKKVKEELTPSAINEIADSLLADSLSICPKDTGKLRESGKVYKRASSSSSYAVVGYNTPYAAIVHEMPSNMSWTTPGTSNKFLERPMKENQARYMSIFNAKIKGKI